MLTEEQAQKVRLVLSTSGWKDVMEPAYKRRSFEALKALALSPSEREKSGGEFKNMDDASLRAIIRECEWMTFVWQNELNVHEMNRRRDELASQEAGGNGFPQPLPANP